MGRDGRLPDLVIALLIFSSTTLLCLAKNFPNCAWDDWDYVHTYEPLELTCYNVPRNAYVYYNVYEVGAAS